ncbi:unnamed protein product [Moneuplotes crassus]|uniref:Uncharacterized protein n=1 Tax=Euplotes crassus TaxID=5936 RepID=A0AAD2D3D2_EUPCR|nr:unnamed protein product [Moneuplotes crassus]
MEGIQQTMEEKEQQIWAQEKTLVKQVMYQCLRYTFRHPSQLKMIIYFSFRECDRDKMIQEFTKFRFCEFPYKNGFFFYDLLLKDTRKVEKFLSKYSQEDMQTFHIFSEKCTILFKPFSRCILRSLCKIQTEISINSFSLTKSNFRGIFEQGHSCKEIGFSSCKFNINKVFESNSNELKFSKEIKYSTESITFQYCGNVNTNNWSDHPHQVITILSAISSCSLIHSLKSLSLTKSCISDDTLSALISKSNLTHLKFLQNTE